tara:strand:+ start:2061 stop:2432 length:372 start_codon:yes stop_codon:yes gene_type:complete
MESLKGVFFLLDNVILKEHDILEKSLNKTMLDWNKEIDTFTTITLEFAISELDKNYLNLFVIPHKEGLNFCNDKDILLGYKLASLKLDESKLFLNKSPYGADSYEKNRTIARFTYNLNSKVIE